SGSGWSSSASRGSAGIQRGCARRAAGAAPGRCGGVWEGGETRDYARVSSAGVRATRGWLGAGWVCAIVTGLTIASYSLVDKAGVARLHPMPYIALMGLGPRARLSPTLRA